MRYNDVAVKLDKDGNVKSTKTNEYVVDKQMDDVIWLVSDITDENYDDVLAHVIEHGYRNKIKKGVTQELIEEICGTLFQEACGL